MQSTRRRFGLLAGGFAAVLIVVALGIGASGAGAQGGGAVSIVDFAFQPASIQVAAGSTVTWTNTGAATHTVTSDSGAFDSGNVAPGASFSHTFDTAGTFTYHCSIHPQMTGTVVVTGGGGQAAAAPTAAPAAAQTTQVPRTGVGATAPAQNHALAIVAALAAALFATGAHLSYRRS
jgi:plastocyanin